MTFPTGVVTSLHGDMSSGAVTVDIEMSGRDEDVSITTNLSSIDSFYTLVHGKVLTQACMCVYEKGSQTDFKSVCIVKLFLF